MVHRTSLRTRVQGAAERHRLPHRPTAPPTAQGVNVCASVALGLVASALCYLVKVQPQAYFYLGVILLVPGSVGAREAATAFEGGDARSGSTFAVSRGARSVWQLAARRGGRTAQSG